jgi:SulP family sulfate permease
MTCRYFCVAGGIALGTSTTIDTLPSWLNLIDKDAALKLVPTLGTCAALMATMEFSRSVMCDPV